MKRGYKKVWDADVPLSSYAPSVQYRFRAEAADLAEELRSGITLAIKESVPREENYDAGNVWKRAKEYVNGGTPGWWLELFHKYERPYTRRKGNGKPYVRRRGPPHGAKEPFQKHSISRANFIKALESIAEGKDLEVGEPVEVTREYGIGNMRFDHERGSRKIRGRLSDTEGCEELFKYLQQHPREGLPSLPMRYIRTIERVFGAGRINDARRAAGVPEEYIKSSKRSESNKGSKTKRVAVRLLFAKTETKTFTRAPNINHARARQLIFDRFTRGYQEGGHWSLPDRRVRNYFGIPLPDNYDEMLADLRRARREERVKARVESGESLRISGEQREVVAMRSQPGEFVDDVPF